MVTTDWEKESRERLASVETQQENIEHRLELLRDGQGEIMDRLNEIQSEAVSQEDLEGIEETTATNTKSRKRREGAYKALAILGSCIAGASGYAIAVI